MKSDAMRQMVIDRIVYLDLGPEATEKEKMLHRAPLHELSNARLIEELETSAYAAVQ